MFRFHLEKLSHSVKNRVCKTVLRRRSIFHWAVLSRKNSNINSIIYATYGLIWFLPIFPGVGRAYGNRNDTVWAVSSQLTGLPKVMNPLLWNPLPPAAVRCANEVIEREVDQSRIRSLNQPSWTSGWQIYRWDSPRVVFITALILKKILSLKYRLSVYIDLMIEEVNMKSSEMALREAVCPK